MNNAMRSLSFDDVIDALADVQRRRILISLMAHNPQDVSSAESDDSATGTDAAAETDAVDRLVSMHHVHLPKLDDYGIVDWDQETDEVVKGPNFEEIRPLLELLQDHEDELPDEWL